MFHSILTFDFDLILGRFLLFWTNNFCFLSFALFLLYHVFLSLCGGGGGWVVVSQRLLRFNPTTVMVVLLLRLWLLLGCGNTYMTLITTL